MKLLLVAGARPNFMKIAPIVRALAAARAAGASDLSWKLVHSGQHYDHGMSKVFFEELEIPEPDFDLGAGSSPASPCARTPSARSRSRRGATSPSCGMDGRRRGLSAC